MSDIAHEPVECPWTPGPWRAYQHGGGDWFASNDTQDAADIRGDTDEECAANAELIALAPEMAEAILCFAEAWKGIAPSSQENRVICEMAVRLRAIGGDHA